MSSVTEIMAQSGEHRQLPPSARPAGGGGSVLRPKMRIVLPALAWVAAWSLAAPLWAAPPLSTPTPAVPLGRLGVGLPLVREMAAGEAHAYDVQAADAGPPLLVTVEQLGIDVTVAAIDPDGRQVALVDSPLDRQGVESLLLAPRVAGRYRIEVRAREPGAPPRGRYRIRLEEMAALAAGTAAGDEAPGGGAAGSEAVPSGPAAGSSGVAAGAGAGAGVGVGTAVGTARPAATRTAAEAAMTAAGGLYAAATPVARRQALGLYGQAQELFRQAGSAEGEVRALYERAVVSRLVDEPGVALALARAALPLWEAVGAGSLAAAADNEIGLDSWLLGQGDQARAAFERARGRSRALGDRYGEAVAASNLCLMDLSRGDLRAGIACYDGALPLLEEVRAEELLAAALTSAGRAYDAIGEPLAARARYRQALERLRSTGNRESEARVRNNVGVLDAGLGEIAEALAQYGAALAIFRDLADRRWQARVVNNIGLVYQATGEPRRARASFEAALPLWRAVGDRAGEMTTLTNLGAIDGTLGEPRQAAAHLAQALDLARVLKDRRGEGIALTQLGRTQLDLGDATAARDSFAQADERLAALGDLPNRAEALHGQGEARAALGDGPGALANLNAALAAFRKAGMQAGEARVLFQLASTEHRFGAAAAGGSLDSALLHAGQALDAFEALRRRIGDPDLGTAFSAVAHQAYELDIELLMEAHRAAPGAGHDREALAVDERARARTLLDVLADAGVAVPAGEAPDLAARRIELAERLAAKAERAARQPAVGAAEKAARENEQQDILRELDLVEAELRERSPAYADLVRPQPLDAAGMQALLDGDTLLLAYSLGEARSYLWAVSSDMVASFELPPRAVIEELARSLQQQWSAGDPALRRIAAATAGALSGILLGPVAGRLGDRRLAIVPDGALDYVPFAALPEPVAGQSGPAPEAASGGQPAGSPAALPGAGRDAPTPRSASAPGTQSAGAPVPLLERHEVVMLPSASTLAVERRLLAGRERPARWLAVFADPVFEPDDPRVSQAVPAARQAAAVPARSAAVPARSSAPPGPEAPDGAAALPGSVPPPGVAVPTGPTSPAPAVPFRSAAWADTPPQAAGAGAPAFARLPASRQEAEAIAALAPPGEATVALDFAASRAAVLGERLNGYRVVHFATHGVLDNDHPSLSGLALSLVDREGRPQQGFLDLRDVYSLRLSADLVVLSGCRTALGREARGEGLVSLARGFQYAGAARVLATLWRIDDRAAAALMTRFYRALFTQGLPPAAALRAAQRSLRQDRRYSDPFFWAAFVLVGDWR